MVALRNRPGRLKRIELDEIVTKTNSRNEDSESNSKMDSPSVRDDDNASSPDTAKPTTLKNGRFVDKARKSNDLPNEGQIVSSADGRETKTEKERSLWSTRLRGKHDKRTPEKENLVSRENRKNEKNDNLVKKNSGPLKFASTSSKKSSSKCFSVSVKKQPEKSVEKMKHIPKKLPTKATIASRLAAKSPSKLVSKSPSKLVSKSPSKLVSKSPSKLVSKSPSKLVSKSPSKLVSKSPSKLVSKSPSKLASKSPSKLASKSPSKLAAKSPSKLPAKLPSKLPAKLPSKLAAKLPSKLLAKSPLKLVAKSPLKLVAKSPSKLAVNSPSKLASKSPSKLASKSPSKLASKSPSKLVSKSPSKLAAKSPIQSPSHFVSETNEPMTLNCKGTKTKTKAKRTLISKGKTVKVPLEVEAIRAEIPKARLRGKKTMTASVSPKSGIKSKKRKAQSSSASNPEFPESSSSAKKKRVSFADERSSISSPDSGRLSSNEKVSATSSKSRICRSQRSQKPESDPYAFDDDSVDESAKSSNSRNVLLKGSSGSSSSSPQEVPGGTLDQMCRSISEIKTALKKGTSTPDGKVKNGKLIAKRKRKGENKTENRMAKMRAMMEQQSVKLKPILKETPLRSDHSTPLNQKSKGAVQTKMSRYLMKPVPAPDFRPPRPRAPLRKICDNEETDAAKSSAHDQSLFGFEAIPTPGKHVIRPMLRTDGISAPELPSPIRKASIGAPGFLAGADVTDASLALGTTMDSVCSVTGKVFSKKRPENDLEFVGKKWNIKKPVEVGVKRAKAPRKKKEPTEPIPPPERSEEEETAFEDWCKKQNEHFDLCESFELSIEIEPSE